MTEKMTRRNAVVLSVAAPTLGLGFPLGGEIDQSAVGINIKIAWASRRWEVLLPDWENISPYWRPGMAVPLKWVPLAEYLKTLEDEFKLAPTVGVLETEKLKPTT